MARLHTILLALTLGAAAVLGPDTGWTRAATEHFVVSGDAPAADIAQLAARLETLRGVLLETLPRIDDRSILPTFIIAFGSERSFEPWRSAGGTVDAYAFHEPFMPCMVLRSQRSSAGEDAVRVVVHEYVHVLADAPWMPLWLIEGIGDYYSTATLSRDGRRAELGQRIPYHIEQATRWWVPLPQVLGTSRASTLADHETGGLALVGPRDRPAAATPLEVAAHWATTGHTAADAPIWSSGPGSAELGGLLDNTKVYQVVRGLLAK
jgi:hypothetical protein